MRSEPNALVKGSREDINKRMSRARFGILLCLMVSSSPCLAKVNVPFDEVQKFLVENGHRFVDIVHNSTVEQFVPKGVYFAKRPLQGSSQDGFSIFMFNPEVDNLEYFLVVIGRRKIKRSLLVIGKNWIEEEKNEMIKLVDSLQMRTLFYVAALSDFGANMSWHQVISLNIGCIIDKLTFVHNSHIVHEQFNLHGLKITSTSATWAPYYTIDGCNEYGLECAVTYGYLKDVLDIFGAWFNFTLLSHKNAENDWGMIPKSGPYSLNGTWGGIMGDVINKKYDLSMSSWKWNIERHELGEFVAVAKTRRMSVLKAQKATDFELFTRVFSDDSWVAISAMVGSILVLMLTVKLIKFEKHSNGEKIMAFSTWMFFVMVNAYYGGALTMFFTGTMTVPFETERDVIQAYPDWKIWIRSGAEHNIYTHVLKGDPDYIKFWERYTNDPNGTIYNSEEEGLDILSRGQNVIMTGESKFVGYLKSNPTNEKLFYFAHSKWEDRSLMFHGNSPLLPMFNHGACLLREQGIIHLLHMKWFGVGTDQSGASLMEKTVLQAGQTVMVFALLLCIFGLSLAILCGELIMKVVNDKSRNFA